jgi:hypothetical protein
MLQGTFETLALPELLGLLAHSRKSGALWLEAGAATAAIYIADGRCCAAQSGDLTKPVEDAPSLLVRLVDLCFAAARTEEGSFRFGNEEPPWVCSETVDLDVAIEELARLLDEWREIQAVVPSLDCRVRLAEELGADQITIDRERWELLVAMDGRRTVRELVRKCNRPILEVCHAIVALVDAGAVSVVALPAPATQGMRRAGKAPSPRPQVEPETPYGPGVESPQRGPGAPQTDDDREMEGAGNGKYLRSFSALHEA